MCCKSQSVFWVCLDGKKNGVERKIYNVCHFFLVHGEKDLGFERWVSVLMCVCFGGDFI